MAETLMICRTCLAMEAKLIKINKYPELSKAFDFLTGTTFSENDNLPPYVCNFCTTLLLKLMKFKLRSQTSDKILRTGLQMYGDLTTEYINNINRLEHSLALSFSIKKIAYSVPDLEIDRGTDKEELDPKDNVVAEPTSINDLPTNNDNIMCQLPLSQSKLYHETHSQNNFLSNSALENVRSHDTVKYLVLSPELNKINITCSTKEKLDSTIFNKTIHISEKNNNLNKKNMQVKVTKNKVKKKNRVNRNARQKLVHNNARKKLVHNNARKKLVHNFKEIKKRKLVIKNVADNKECQNEVVSSLKTSYKCDKCERRFSDDGAYEYHMIYHDVENLETENYECQLCGEIFSRAFILETHVQTVHLSNPI